LRKLIGIPEEVLGWRLHLNYTKETVIVELRVAGEGGWTKYKGNHLVHDGKLVRPLEPAMEQLADWAGIKPLCRSWKLLVAEDEIVTVLVHEDIVENIKPLPELPQFQLEETKEEKS